MPSHQRGTRVRGGGIFASFGNTIIMYGDCHFANNYATNDGGGIYADMFSDVSFQRDSTFINNSAQQHGGGLYINESNVTFANSSKFEWNSAVSGGGIYVLLTTDTDVFSNVSLHRNTTFMHNSAKDTGGAIHADFGTFLKITGISVFGNNSAHRGGSLYGSRWCQFEFSGSILFENNSASDTGGGIYIVGIGFNIHNFIFRNNKAVKAGAVYAEACILKFTGYNIFENNFAQNHGGVILMTRSTILFSGFNIFQNNTAHDGGVVHATVCKNVHFSLDNHFISNLAHSQGGGIYAVGSKLNFTDGSLFIGNIAKQGAGVYGEECITLFRDSTFKDTSAEELGAGICLKSKSTLDFNGC